MKKLQNNKDVKENSQQRDLFPEEINFQILTKIPATYLQNKFRNLCKSWHNLISSSDFISQNILDSKSELLISVPTSQFQALPFYEAKLLRIENKEQALDFELKNFPMGRMGERRSSCNGLILVCDPKHKALLYVMNIVTKCWLKLPNSPSDCSHLDCGMALCFDPSTKHYKVVHIFSDRYGFEIFTLGCSDNAWKTIPGPFNSSEGQPIYVYANLWQDPVCINDRVLHWYIKSDRFIISMNVSDEKSRKTYLPECCWRSDKYRYELVEMGEKLALVYKVSESQIDVWILEDSDGHNWIKRHSIMAGSIVYRKCRPNFMKLFAVASLQHGEVLVFRHEGDRFVSNWLFLYDMKQGKLKKVWMKIKPDCKFLPHRSSLIRPTNENSD